ncbi:ABC transporter ATP-binding protein [Amycolatopsis alkalitolerans]|uniref:ABC transporter ATP-binding protein n=1 Tax=Amycolatopsis alkalitolerans TaxID=2547244 RepID=A0A5C4LZA7_9PSEU|nr:ABC transporter ATP-binding protein [Amycolatopsis alkalitolerans]TNC25187.1 ABC transporter ATP-binding protein [Amycolatopsis alkalitolerans]
MPDSPTAEVILTASDLTYTYPSGVQALGGVDLTVRKGEIVSVVGPSGCGKSTLLSLVTRFAQPTSGTLEWSPEITERVRRRGGHLLSMVFQRDTIFPWRTVRKNVQFGMESLKLDPAEKTRRTESLLALGGLAATADSYPRALSGGMRRRLALLMALSVHPEVLLLDEPFAALDEPTRVELTGEVLELARRAEISVLLVTHDLAEAISLSDRVVVMSNRPARIRRVVDVPLGRDRDIIALRETPEYGELYRELWHELWAAIEDKATEGTVS